MVVASDGPLPPYNTWKTQVPGGLAWAPMDREGLWTYDGAPPSDASRSPRATFVARSSAARLSPEVLIGLCDRLRQSPGVTLVRAVAFPVKPDKEIMK